MPIHHRVGYEVARRVAPYARGLLQSDKLALNYAWRGFKHKSSIVSGIRTGLVGGSIGGAFIRDDEGLGEDGQIPFNAPNQFKKTYSRSSRRSYGRSNYKRGTRRYKRCSCARKRKRSRYR